MDLLKVLEKIQTNICLKAKFMNHNDLESMVK